MFGKDVTFLSPGDWMIDLIELQEVIKWSRRRKQSRSSAEAFVRRANDLPDVDTLKGSSLLKRLVARHLIYDWRQHDEPDYKACRLARKED